MRSSSDGSMTPAVRALGVVHGISPVLSDRLLRSLRGGTAAPRLD